MEYPANHGHLRRGRGRSTDRARNRDCVGAESGISRRVSVRFEDDRFDCDEQRFITIGLLSGEFVVIAHTEENEDVTRIISMRKATKHEETIFFKAFEN